MKIDIHTLVFVLAITSLLNFVVFLFQYLQNKDQKGLLWWMLGSASLALGFGVNCFRDIRSIEAFAILTHNIFLIASMILFYSGVLDFFGRKKKISWLMVFCVLTTLCLSYFIFFDNNMSSRRIIMSITLAVISFLITWILLACRAASITPSARFLASLFLFNGIFLSLRALWPSMGENETAYFASSMSQTITFMVSLITMILMSFGFMLLLNQRLNAQHREIKEHFELIFKTSPNCVTITRFDDGCFIDINEGFTELTGYTRADVIGKTSLEINLWESEEERQKIITPLQQKGFCRSIKALMKRKDGSRMIGLVSSRIIDMQGIPHIISVTNDITMRTASEEALRDSEAQYRRIVDTALEGVITLDSGGRFLFVNQQMASLLGYAVEELLGQTLSSMMPEDQLQQHFEQMKERAQGKDALYERCLRKKDGTRHWFLVSAKAVIDSKGNFAGSFAMFTDINERKVLEESTVLHNQRLQVLLSLTQMKDTEMQIILDRALDCALQLTRSTIGYIYHYREEEKLFVLNSWSPEALKECRIIAPQTTYHLDSTGIWGEAVRQRKPIIINDFQAQNPLKKGYPEGHVTLKRYLTVPVFSGGAIVGVIGVGNKSEPYDNIDVLQLDLLAESVWSISHQKEDERKIRQYAQELQELNATKDRFFNLIAHDLRSPFHGILTMSEVLLDNMKSHDGEMVAECVALIRDTAKSAYTMLENLLEWARVQTGKIEFNPGEIAFVDLLNHALRVSGGQARNKNITIEHFSHVESIYADKNMIDTVLRNLLSNAVKFTPRNGTITIKALEKDDHVEISVTDTGIGMSSEVQSNIFRLSKTVTTRGTEGEKGTGFGLLLCREFIEAHKGTLHIESTEGKGSTFIFTLPRSAPGAQDTGGAIRG